MAYLKKRGNFVDAATPDLILLVLNMPIIVGREVLQKLAASETVGHIPVVVLTTSGCEHDVLEMYRRKCNANASKPLDNAEFQRVIQGIADFYFTVIVLPPRPE